MSKSIRMLIRHGLFPFVYFGMTALVIHLVSSGYNTWATLPPLVISAALLIAICEFLNPQFTEWRPRWPELKIDLLHYAVNYGIKQIAVLLMGLGLSYVSFDDGPWPSDAPFVLQVVLAALVFDFVLYWIHRLSHRENLLWRLHTIHHSPNKLYFLNGEKRHPLHQIAEGVPALLALVLLGAPPAVVVAFLTFLNFNMLLQHANVDYRMGALKYVFAGAQTHRYHHYRDIDRHVGIVNLAQIFVPFDIMFGTFYYRSPGVGCNEAGVFYLPQFPSGYAKQMQWPFSRRLRAEYIADIRNDPVRIGNRAIDGADTVTS
ncbi:MAG: sterol desaturase family protein [Pseudomonadota bacterium]